MTKITDGQRLITSSQRINPLYASETFLKNGESTYCPNKTSGLVRNIPSQTSATSKYHHRTMNHQITNDASHFKSNYDID